MEKQEKIGQDMKKEKKKNANRGITLIALVISIVVLLILAGVSIATLTGENRNFNTSPKSKGCNRAGGNKRTSRAKQIVDRNEFTIRRPV